MLPLCSNDKVLSLPQYKSQTIASPCSFEGSALQMPLESMRTCHGASVTSLRHVVALDINLNTKVHCSHDLIVHVASADLRQLALDRRWATCRRLHRSDRAHA